MGEVRHFQDLTVREITDLALVQGDHDKFVEIVDSLVKIHKIVKETNELELLLKIYHDKR